MTELLRRWRYDRYAAKKGGSEKFADFEEWASGPWTPAIAHRVPMPELLQGPPLGAINDQSRKVIDMELERRSRSVSPMIANVISLLALAVAVAAVVKPGGDCTFTNLGIYISDRPGP